MKNKTLMQKIREGINKPIGKAILTAALLGGCRANYTKPTYVTKMNGDSIEIYEPFFRAPLMRILKEDGTKLRFYDNRARVYNDGSPGYVDRIEVEDPNGKRRIYKNKLGIEDKYDPLFKAATLKWKIVDTEIKKEKKEQPNPSIDSVLKLIKGK